VREGYEAGADAAALECRDLREWIPGDRSLLLRPLHRQPGTRSTGTLPTGGTPAGSFARLAGTDEPE